MAEANSQKLTIFALGVLLFLTSFAFAYAPDVLNFKTLMFAILGALGVAFVFIPTNWAMVCYFYYVGIEGFAKVITNYNPIIHVGADLLVIGLALRIFITSLVHRRNLLHHTPPLTPLFVVHYIWFIIAIANPYALGLIPSLAGAKMYVTMTTLYFFGYSMTKSAEDVRRYIMPWTFVFGLQAVTSIYQAMVGPSSVVHLGPAFVEALKKFEGLAFRPFGITSQPGMPSIYIYIAFPFMLYVFIHAKNNLMRIYSMIMIPAGAATLFICQVRSALLKAMLGFMLYLMMSIKWTRWSSTRIKRNIILAVSTLTIAFAIVTPRILKEMTSNNDDNSRAIERTLTLFDKKSAMSARSGAWDRIVKHVKIAPLGSGLSRSGAVSRLFVNYRSDDPLAKEIFFTDNFWVALIIDLGIPGAFIMSLLLLIFFIRATLSIFHYTSFDLLATHGVVLCVVGIIAFGCFAAEPLLYNPEASAFWFFAGVLMKLPTLNPVQSRRIDLAALRRQYVD